MDNYRILCSDEIVINGDEFKYVDVWHKCPEEGKPASYYGNNVRRKTGSIKFKSSTEWECQESKCYETVLAGLFDCKIMHIIKHDNGDFYIEENCDEYYGTVLTKEQLIALGNELIQLANT